MILRVEQGLTEVPVPKVFTGAPGAITWQGVHKRHKDWFCLFFFPSYKSRTKDTYSCLDRKLGMQSKEVATDTKSCFLPTLLLLWRLQFNQSIDTAFLLGWAGNPPQGRLINTKLLTAKLCWTIFYLPHPHLWSSKKNLFHGILIPTLSQILI